MEKSDHVWMSHTAVCVCLTVGLSGQEWIAFITCGFVFYQTSQFKIHFWQRNCLLNGVRNFCRAKLQSVCFNGLTGPDITTSGLSNNGRVFHADSSLQHQGDLNSLIFNRYVYMH